ncbi:MAG: GNAT family N-acetyltransferase [Geodermatophilaceae bacterium]
MGRLLVRVRDAAPEDIDVLLGFAAQVLDSGETADVNARSPMVRLAEGVLGHQLRERYARLLADREHRVVLAESDEGRPVGVAVFSVDMISALLAVPVVYVSHVVVPGLERDRAVGRALVEAATTFAEEIGAEHVIVGLNPGGRESNRFFARLGFTPLIMRRIASVPTLRRSLTDVPVKKPRPLGSRLASPRLRGGT